MDFEAYVDEQASAIVRSNAGKTFKENCKRAITQLRGLVKYRRLFFHKMPVLTVTMRDRHIVGGVMKSRHVSPDGVHDLYGNVLLDGYSSGSLSFRSTAVAFFTPEDVLYLGGSSCNPGTYRDERTIILPNGKVVKKSRTLMDRWCPKTGMWHAIQHAVPVSLEDAAEIYCFLSGLEDPAPFMAMFDFIHLRSRQEMDAAMLAHLPTPFHFLCAFTTKFVGKTCARPRAVFPVSSRLTAVFALMKALNFARHIQQKTCHGHDQQHACSQTHE